MTEREYVSGETFDEFVKRNKTDEVKEEEKATELNVETTTETTEIVKADKKYCCPICKGKIDLQHYAFVLEVMKDSKKQEAWRKKEYTFKMWQEEHK